MEAGWSDGSGCWPFALLVLGLNSLYLAARADASLLYFGNVGLHVVLGLGAAAALGRLARRHWAGLDGPWRSAAVVFALGAVLGVVLLFTGATRPFRALLYAHVGLVGLGALLALAAGLRRGLPVPAGVVRASATAAALLAVAAAGARAAADLFPPRHPIANAALAPATMEGEGQGPRGPFFPSSAETNTGGPVPSNFFMKSEDCARCHKDIYDQWNSSAHHFASFNNQWYRKSIEYMQDVVGTKPSKWCAGCHDHAVVFAGKFDRPIKEQVDTPEAQVGLSCTSCHSIVHVKSTMGQGDFTIEYPPLHDLAVSENPLVRAGHDYMLKLDPGPHSRTFLKSFHTDQTPEFCASCHKVHLDVPVNAYRWIRGFNEYDNWQASGVSGEGARSFYYPPKPQGCADCHMPLVTAKDPAAREGKVHSHRFPAANTALPFVNRDEEQLQVTQAFLKSGAVTSTCSAWCRGSPAPRDARGRRRRAPAQHHVRGGGGVDELRRRAGVRRAAGRGGGPARQGGRGAAAGRHRRGSTWWCGRAGSATSSRAAPWTPSTSGSSSRSSTRTGRRSSTPASVEGGGRGPVEPGAHFYRSLMLDERGNVVNKRNAWATRSVAYVRLIPPGAADTVHYRLRIPEDCGDRVTVKARLNYRKFAWWNTQWAFAGVRDPGDQRLLARARPRRRPLGLHRRHVAECRGRSRPSPTSRSR